jgi:pimeloyl-ACP methyl ester carboxylesterase
LAGTLHHLRRGSGEPLVLVHGVGSRGAAFGPVVDLLAAERDVIAVDLPGFADSPLDGTPLDVPGFAGRLARFFAELGLERPHLAGNSMGGGIGFELAARGALRSLTAISPIGFWGPAERLWSRSLLEGGRRAGALSTRMPEWAQVAGARPATFLYAFGKPFSAPREEILATVVEGREAPAFKEAIVNISTYEPPLTGDLRRTPLTVAWGSRDVLLPYPTCSRRARRLLPWARHVTLRGCGHVPFFDDPALCARVILDGSAPG